MAAFTGNQSNHCLSVASAKAGKFTNNRITPILLVAILLRRGERDEGKFLNFLVPRFRGRTRRAIICPLPAAVLPSRNTGLVRIIFL